jgi:hypothetical protein
MNQEEIIELTKPKRAPRKQKNVSIEPTTTQVEVIKETPVVVKQEPIEQTPIAKTPKTRKPPKANASPTPAPTPAPTPKQQEPVVEPTTTPLSTPKQPSMDMSEFHKMYQQFLQSQQPPTTLPQQTQPNDDENNSTNDKKPKKTIKKITIKSEQEDIKYKIDLIKNKITDKKNKKTKNENDYLRDQLAQLEEELEALQVDVPKTKRTNSKTIKIPADKVDNIIGSQSQNQNKIPLHQLLRGFGF